MPAIPVTLYVANSTIPYADQSNQDGLRAGGVSGSITKGSTITITDSGFGTGPNVVHYDGLDGTAAALVDPSDPLIGSYGNTPTTYYEAGGRDGSTCARIIDGTGSFHKLNVLYGSNVTEHFISYGYRSAPGSYPPSTSGDTPDAFPSSPDSYLKQLWFGYGATFDSEYNDLVFLTLVGSTAACGFHLAGNDYNYWLDMGGTQNGTTGYWRFGPWMRNSLHMKAGATPEVDNGTTNIQILNGSTISTYSKTDAPLFDVDKIGSEPYAWDRFNIPGWCRGGASGTVQHQVDDLYLAVGANSAKRVELGNNATYTACTKLAICPSSAWSDTSITATVEIADLDLGGDVWLFVLDEDGAAMYIEKVL